MRAVSAKALFVLLLSTLLPFQGDNHIHTQLSEVILNHRVKEKKRFVVL